MSKGEGIKGSGRRRDREGSSDGLREGDKPGSSISQSPNPLIPALEPASNLPELEGYDLVERLGHGGMGVVYEAFQRSTGRRVAVKFMLDSSLASETARRRFEREVELVARLQHPNIVTVIDSGLQRGRYYYVMEHIEGLALDGWRPSAFEDALIMMATVCDAVDHAHQRGVLHRDLKPSNILIDAQGKPHLLDFGLAKLLSENTGIDRVATLSEPGQILGTLAYMSPEQFRGAPDAAGVRADVYSLGAILYELTTGRLPVEVNGPIDEVAQRVLLRDPPAPSSRFGVSVPARRERLGVSLTDFDAIVLKSLEKDPQRRYGAARELADDLRRCLAREIVSARRAGTVTRLIRWTQRRRGVAATMGVAVLVVLSTAIYSFLSVTREKNRAQSAAAKLAVQVDEVTRVLSFTQSMIERTARESAHQRDIKPLLAMLADAEQRIPNELAGHPEAEAALRRSIGMTYQNLGRSDDAERNLQRTLTLRRAGLPDGGEAAITALLDLAWLHDARSRPEEAQARCEEALALARRIHGDASPKMVDVLHPMAYLLQGRGELERAERTWRDLLARWRTQNPEPDAYTVEILNNLATLREQRGDASDAERLYREALDLNHQRVPRGDLQTSLLLGNLARIVAWRDLAAAEALLREDLAIQRRERGDADPNVLNGWNVLAANLMHQGRYALARTEYEALLKAHESAGRSEDESLAFALCNLGGVTYLDGDFGRAHELFQRASHIFQRVHEHPTADDAATLSNRAAALEALGRYKEAESVVHESLKMLRGITNRREYYEANALSVLALIRLDLGHDAEADAHYRRALALFKLLPEGGGADAANVQVGLAQIMLVRGDPARAEVQLREALERLRRHLGGDHPDLGVAMVRLGSALRDQGKYDEAEAAYKEAMATLGRRLDAEHPLVGLALFEWGGLRQRRGDAPGAEKKWKEALRIRERRLPPDHPDIVRTRAALRGEEGKGKSVTHSEDK